jgi:hypothetical protein
MHSVLQIEQVELLKIIDELRGQLKSAGWGATAGMDEYHHIRDKYERLVVEVKGAILELLDGTPGLQPRFSKGSEAEKLLDAVNAAHGHLYRAQKIYLGDRNEKAE